MPQPLSRDLKEWAKSASVTDLEVTDDLTLTDDLSVGGDITASGTLDVTGAATLRVVNVGGSTAGALDNVVIGASTAAAATVTAFTASSSVVVLSGLTSVDPSVAGQLYKNSTGQLLVSAG